MSKKQIHIMIVEDEESISLLLKYNLEKAGYKVTQALDGVDALEKMDSSVPDLIIADLMMPRMNGYELTQEVRKLEYTKDIPIIMLTARGQESDKLQGFENGVDDYLTKPFSIKELSARVKAILKRSNSALLSERISYGNIDIDNNKKAAFASGKKIDLTVTEFNLLRYLVERPEIVHSREALLRRIWKDESEVESRAVDTAIRRVRAALEETSSNAHDLIKTVRGEGYILEA